MSDASAGRSGVLLRMSVPASGDLRAIVDEVAAKIAEYVGQRDADASSLTSAIDNVAARVAPADPSAEITFEFRESDGGLLIEARCGARRSEVRCPLPA